MSPQACAEVIEILKYIPKDAYDKIPESMINQLHQNADENSNFTYNAALDFSEQKISQEAKDILARIVGEL